MAKRITFTRDFDYFFPMGTVAGREGVTDLVKDEVADAAIAAGAATLVEPKLKSPLPKHG